MITRIITVGDQRLGNVILSLHFDHFLQPRPDRTIIITSLASEHVQAVLANYFPNNNIEVFSDSFFEQRYWSLKFWQDQGNLRGSWLKQQALKLIALDYFESEIFLLQDPDTFMIAPYHYVSAESLNLFVLPDTTQSQEYYNVLPKVLGINRQVQDSFVTDIMPVYKQDWLECAQTIAQMTRGYWLEQIINSVEPEPFGKYKQVKWFSEYEFLGNWSFHRRAVNTRAQKRFEFNDVEKLTDLDSNFDCVCDKGRRGQVKGDPSIFGVTANQVENLDKALTILSRKISC